MGVTVACVFLETIPAHNVMGRSLRASLRQRDRRHKASELVAWSAGYFVECIRRCLEASGATRSWCNWSRAWPEAADALTQSARWHILRLSAPSWSPDGGAGGDEGADPCGVGVGRARIRRSCSRTRISSFSGRRSCGAASRAGARTASASSALIVDEGDRAQLVSRVESACAR